ncbi:hypothetical protein [Nocardia thailandica]|uniref:hypothetical protein n=1 Tax=Nocardia thailandica TaxID=257275 RepID=UPI0012FC0323|nr:hypothetical protein [Nocardia thailandica]
MTVLALLLSLAARRNRMTQLIGEVESLAHDLRWLGDPDFADRAYAIAQKYGATK